MGLQDVGLFATLLFMRVCLGLFFSISGYHKLFNVTRHEKLRTTLTEDGIPFVRYFQWFVPGVEFLGGLALISGLLTSLAAFGLMIICLTACITDGIRRIPFWAPIDRADWLDDILYLPETLYILMLLIFVWAGGGLWSIDTFLWRFA